MIHFLPDPKKISEQKREEKNSLIFDFKEETSDLNLNSLIIIIYAINQKRSEERV